MFPSIDNASGLEAVDEILEYRESNSPPAECVGRLSLCLKCNNSIFNNTFYLQEDETAMGPHLFCSYSDIVMYKYDLKDMSYTPIVFFVIWNHSLEELHQFVQFVNSIEISGKIRSTMSVAKDSALEFLDLSLHINEHNKICVDVYAKPTNSFTYVLLSTCYPKKNINNISKGIAL